MFEGLRNFFRRHRRKFIGSAVLIGGGYVACRVLVPKIIDWYLQRMLKQGGFQDLLAQLDQEMPPDREQEKETNFKVTQQVCSQYSQKDGKSNLDKRLAPHFAVDERTAELKQATTTEEKLRCIEAIQVECLSRLLSSLYALHLVFLLHRIQFNILGREMTFGGAELLSENPGRPEEERALSELFLKCDRHVRNEGLSQICEALRAAIKERWAAEKLQVRSTVSAASLQSFLTSACRVADTTLIDCKCGPELLLPKALDSDGGDKVAKLLDEARDYCESPHFLDVFRSAVDGAIKQVVESLAGCIDDETVAPLPSEAEVPVMKLGGGMIKRAQAMLKDDDGGFHKRFDENPLLEKFCKAVLFQESGN